MSRASGSASAASTSSIRFTKLCASAGLESSCRFAHPRRLSETRTSSSCKRGAFTWRDSCAKSVSMTSFSTQRSSCYSHDLRLTMSRSRCPGWPSFPQTSSSSACGTLPRLTPKASLIRTGTSSTRSSPSSTCTSRRPRPSSKRCKPTSLST